MAVSLLQAYSPSQGSTVTATVASGTETRPLKVNYVEPVNSEYHLTANGTYDLLNVTGRGNVDRIMLAIITSAGAVAAYDAYVDIWVDGVREMRADVGTFFLLHGYATTSGNNNTFATDRVGVNYSTNGGNALVGAYRKINIPYTGSIKIQVVNTSASTSGQIYSQVDYYEGAAPLGRYPENQQRFHSYFTGFTNVAQYGNIDLMPQINGSGCIEGIQQITYSSNSNVTFLEGNPSIVADGYTFKYGGTEDFFGGQYYWNGNKGRTNEWGVAWKGQTASIFLYGTYRYFHQSPFVFNSGFKYNWINGQVNQGAAPGTATVSCLTTYYTST